jgi:hypothetical protein
MIGLAYGAADFEADMTPNVGNKISGSKAVTENGIASVTHHAIIHAATASTL